MTPPARDRRGGHRARGRRRPPRWSIRLALILLVFALGIALGEALHDSPQPGKTFTFDRTVPLTSVPPGSTITP